MCFKMISACLMILCVANPLIGQQTQNNKKPRYIVIPPDVMLITVASQPDCPLQLEEVYRLYDIENELPAWTVQVRNRGAKPLRVKSYTVAWIYPRGTGGFNGLLGSSEEVLPGQRLPSNDDVTEIVPLTETLRDKLGWRGEMKATAVMLIESIEFADGTTYDAKPLSDALQKFFEETSIKLNRLENLERRK